MSDAPTLFAVQNGIATLTLNQAARMNPLTPALQQGCLDALQRVRDDSAIRVLVLTGRGKGFCVGADLAALGRAPSDAPTGAPLGDRVAEMMEKTGNPMVAGLRALPVPVVCAVNGAAAGGGVGLALAADIVIAARSAYFYLPFVPALGLVPDMGSSWFLPRAVGRARALGLTLLGDRLSADRAVQMGLIWGSVDDDELEAETARMAARLAALPAHAVVETRALFSAAERNDLGAQLAFERERQRLLIDGPSFQEGVRAFLEKRRPRFDGRGTG